jgi:hypothetical protein
MLQSRPVAATEQWLINSNCRVLLALQIEPTKTPEVIETLLDTVLGLRLRTDGTSLIRTPKPFIHSLPSSVSSCSSACDYSRAHHTPPCQGDLATLAANRDFVVLNINHLAGDGIYVRNLINNLTSKKIPPSPFPATVEDFYLNSLRDITPGYGPLPTTYKTKGCRHQEPFAWTRRIGFSVAPRELRCFSPEQRRCVGLTESIWTSLGIAAIAWNDTISPICCITCADMRGMIPERPNDLDVCNHFTSIRPSTPYIGNESVAKHGRRMRESFTKLFRKEGLLAPMAAAFAGEYWPPLDGVPIEMSTFGPIEIRAPVKDVFVANCLIADYAQDAGTLMSFSCRGEGVDRIDFNFRYGPNTVSHGEAKRFFGSVEYLLKNLDADVSMDKAVEIAQSIQRRGK